ncbi:MAG TPA: hypothetical protein VEG32_05285 [Clostridia bacterium]|nr:hypothetical protein [Clostridia bacterium]
MKQIRALVGLLVVIGAFYLAWQVFPAYYANYAFQDYLENQARIESYAENRSDMDVADAVALKAQELEIPLTAQQIHVERVGKELTIWAEYTVQINLPGYPLELNFRPGTKNKKI